MGFRRLTSAHSRQISSGISPTRISTAKIRQPRQSPNAASRNAAPSSGTRTQRATLHPALTQTIRAAVLKKAPMAWAKRFGGPGVSLGAKGSLGAATRVANWPSGLSEGPVSTRAQKP